MDVMDQQILQCLMLDGRASMRRIADVVGVSEQTANRRYRAMREAGVLRVLVSEAAASSRRGLWLLRLQCRPASAAHLGGVLAARDDVSWVALHSGGAELMCTTTLPADAACGTGVLPRISHTAAVLSFTTHMVLHSYSGGPAEWSGFEEPLSKDAQRDLLEGRDPRRRKEAYSPVLLEDRALLAELGRDGRATASALARALDWPLSRVRSRLQALLDNGAVTVDVDVMLEAFGYRVSATLLLQVSPNRIVTVCESLSSHRQTSWVAAVTGSANVAASVTCRDSVELFRYVTEQAGTLPGVLHVEIVPLLARLKQAATRVADGRLVQGLPGTNPL
ncbi:Lrp/AsnC family transcriptional regulator [Streptomyces sp. NBC_01239]|uniref:Lrp/AsnC family transcriptional regulator n=1 Tax=Streptomyces sp. NBC_01239 TaxID=2903792 RepID=UPI002250437A|nr:Lrp/AsnC family transcriptional regulator [Streptomyces sp. NBC_01239]MCX4816475.1 Lrp/AsnC family transcriptional regulator [Streptomyces sp. NBC_01239]